jgi:outer membrane immunogenic protein
MNRFILTISAFSAGLVPGYALSADAVIPSTELTIDIPQADYDWTGPYIGIFAGYGFGGNDATLWADYAPADGIYEPRDNIDTIDAEGFLGGLDAGFNWQSGSFVYGIEGDIAAARMEGSDVDEFTFPLFQNGLRTEYNWMGTVRGRLGVAADNLLFYGTAGVAFANFTDSITGQDVGSPTVDSFGQDFTKAGLAVGAGVEVAVTENITIKGEYLFANFGDTSFNVNEVSGSEWFGPGTDAFSNIDHQVHAVRVGANFKF